MHVAGVLIFKGSAPPYQEFLDHIAARLDHVPRYRQRLATVPFAQGRPVWVDDTSFDLRYHVRATAFALARERVRAAGARGPRLLAAA